MGTLTVILVISMLVLFVESSYPKAEYRPGRRGGSSSGGSSSGHRHGHGSSSSGSSSSGGSSSGGKRRPGRPKPRPKCGRNAHRGPFGCVCNKDCHGNPSKGCVHY